MNFLSDNQKGSFYAIISGLCYGLLGYFGVTLMNSGFSIAGMLFWRFLIATLFMLVILIPEYKTLLQSHKESLKVIIYGVTFYSGSAIIYFISSKYIGTGLAMVIFFTYPAIVMLFNFLFLQAAISKTYYLAFIMIIVGMVCLADIQDASLDIVGIGLGLLCAVFYSGYIIASKESRVPPMLSTLMVSIGGAITCFILSCKDPSFCVPINTEQWLNIFGVAIICTVIPILLLLQGLKYISSEKASILSVLEPVVVVIVGITLLNEQINNMQIIGIIIVLSGAVLTLFSNSTPHFK
jgi:drug/metabolite transporter (DMT)-like permease